MLPDALEPIVMIGRPGTVEIAIIALIVFFLFGAKKIPEFARSLGEAKKAFEEGGNLEPEQDTTPGEGGPSPNERHAHVEDGTAEAGPRPVSKGPG